MVNYKKNCKCAGLPESTVLAVKSVFNSSDIQELLIVKDDGRIVYHNRECNEHVDDETNISTECKDWFNLILVDMQTQRIEEECIEGRIKSEEFTDELETNLDVAQGPVIKVCPDLAAPQDIKMFVANHIRETELHSLHKDYTLTKVNQSTSETVKKKSVLNIQGESILKQNTHCHAYAKDALIDDDVEELVDDLSVEVGNKMLENSREESSCHRIIKSDKPCRIINTRIKSQKPKKFQKDSCSEELKCTVCNKEFAKKSILTRHQKTHTREREECTVCKQMVKDLTKHMKYKHTDKDILGFFCDICGRGFKDASAYSYHKSGHTGERNYSCSTCKKQYRNSSEKKKCEWGHLGIFKYTCSVCGYRTHQKNKFARHSRIHNKEAPFTCPICYLSLARKDYLQKHMIKKHGDHKILEIEQKFPKMYEAKEIIESLKPQIVDENESSLQALNKDVTVYVISS